MSVTKGARACRLYSGAALSVWAALAGMTGMASAQQTESADAGGIEDIVVTAQRRSENLQDVPIAVSAVTAERMEAQGSVALDSLDRVAPGLSVTRDNAAPKIFLRGVGNTAVGPGQDPSTAVYVDGVYIATPAASLLPFNNVERIEVLRGPQGTLFGRNATGGLVQVITADPSVTPEMRLSLGAASYNTLEGQFYGSTPLGDQAGVNLALYARRQEDGWGTNLVTGNDVYNGQDYALRTRLLLDISPQTSLRVSADLAYGHTTYAERQLLPDAVGSGGAVRQGGWYDVAGDQDALHKYHSGGLSVNFQHELSWANFMSLSAYRDDIIRYAIDQDGTPAPVLNAYPINYEMQQFSQEFQLQSLEDAPFSWIVGLYYFNGPGDVGPVTRYGSQQAANFGSLTTYADLSTESYAAFGQATFPVLTNTNLTLGYRYTYEERGIDGYSVRGNGSITGASEQTTSWTSPTWRVALDHHLSDDIMLFASYSRGFKSGMYVPFTPNQAPADPETLDAYEVGAKIDMLDRRLRLNVSGFHYDYQDMQVTVRQLGSSFLINAAEAEIDGVDLELEALVTDDLSLRAAVSVLDGTYTSFPDAVIVIPTPANCVTLQPAGPPTGGNTNCTGDASGNRLVQAPEVSGTVGANYRFGNFIADVSYYYNSGIFFEVDNRIEQEAYGLLAAQLSYDFSDSLRVRLWGRNLLDEEYMSGYNSSSADVMSAGSPRTIGVAFDLRM